MSAQECGNCACNQGRSCSIGPRVQRIPTRRPLYWRIAESKPAIVAAYVLLVIVVVLANLEKFA